MHLTYTNRVRFAETDKQGIVFYGNYVTYQDEAVNGYLREVYPYDSFEGWDIHVVNVDLSYRTTASFEDELENRVGVAEIGESSITFEYECSRDGQVVAEGTVTHVAVDEEGRPTRVPDDFRAAVDAFESDGE
ncbi:acyl-CoA thioesterase [Natronomonas sp. EA1]|uniref:acyl-CoA thioesterase n=1 Tax=Natronomonas sp. EA1 TaxID=3421655 RepID=UPI003EB9D415